MASTFLGLSITSRGLNASQIGLATTTNNMSNVDTTGYSRQIVNQTAIGPAAVYSGSSVGEGVEVTSVDRVRSSRLDQKYWQQNSAASKADATSTYLKQVEKVFGSTDTSDITTDLNTFSKDLSTLSSSPTDTSARATVLADAQTLCSTINTASSTLTSLRSDADTDVKTAVEQINSDATKIATLNKQISEAKTSGASTNELEDQRGLVVDDLSGLVGVNATQEDNGNLTVTVDGSTLVSGNKANQLECYTITDTTSAENGMSGIRWADSGKEFNTGDSGALNGYLQVRDGTTEESGGIPYYSSQLDNFARTFAQAFNEGVTSGNTTYNGSADGVGIGDNATTGTRFFSYNNVSSAGLMASGSDTESVYSNITAANISVSKDVADDTNKIATASSTGGDSNTDNLSSLISICTNVNISGNCTVSGLYNVTVAQVAGSSAAASNDYDRKTTSATYINTSRNSVSAVSSDEETINLTTYQSAYAASASMASTWSDIYKTTINMVNS